MRFRTLLLPATLAYTLFSGAAIAGPCDAYFTFDGNLQDSGGNGYHGQMIGEDGARASAQFVEGKHGQALQLDGTSAMRSFIDLHYEACPQAAFTAWIQSTEDERTGVQYIVSTGSGRWLGVHTLGTSLVLNGPANGINQSGVLRANAGWIFVAGVYDYETKSYTFYVRNRGVTKKLGNLRNPEEALWVGAFNDGMANPANGILIDDLRIYGQTLSADEISAIQVNAAAAQGTDTQAAATTPPSEALPSCSAHSGCAPGNYCAWDHTCHPENHAPMQALEVMPGTAPVEGFILDENARSENDETPDGPAARQSDEPVTENVAPHPAGEPQESRLAGAEGNIRRRVDLVDNFMNKITWEQANQIPCEIMIGGWNSSHAYQSLECASRFLMHEIPDEPGYRTLDREVTLNGKDSAIGRVRVCNRSSNSRLKGIQIWGEQINTDGTTTYRDEADAEEFTNCNGNWSGSVLCPVGMLATGLVVHANDRGGDGKAEIVGLRLICRGISIEG